MNEFATDPVELHKIKEFAMVALHFCSRIDRVTVHYCTLLTQSKNHSKNSIGRDFWHVFTHSNGIFLVLISDFA